MECAFDSSGGNDQFDSSVTACCDAVGLRTRVMTSSQSHPAMSPNRIYSGKFQGLNVGGPPDRCDLRGQMKEAAGTKATEIKCPACNGIGYPVVMQPVQPGRKIYPAKCKKCG